MATATLAERVCKNCGTWYAPRDRRQRCCTKACGAQFYQTGGERLAAQRIHYAENRDEIRRKVRERYQTDEGHRIRVRTAVYEGRKRNPERAKEIAAKCRETPERREKARQVSRSWHAKNFQQANVRRIERKQVSRVREPWLHLFNGAKKRATDAGLPFDLTHEWARDRWTGRCELTGLPFTVGLRGRGAKLMSPSIDKIDPVLGYVKSNSRFILWAVNAFKYDGTDEQMMLIARRLLFPIRA